jgi:very-short-patch-repair endonuclease
MALTPPDLPLASPAAKVEETFYSIPYILAMTIIYNKIQLKARRRELRKRMTDAEVLLWSKIKSSQVDDLRFRRQVSIGAYVVDFYLPSVHLAVEVDGSIHDRPEIKEYDNARQEELESANITVLRFTNEDVMFNLNGVLEEISKTAAKLKKRKV